MMQNYNDDITDRYFTSTTTLDSTRPYFKKHYHSWFEIYCLTGGAGHYLIEDTIYDLMPHDIVLIPAYSPHKAYYDSKHHSCFTVNISNTYLPTFVNDVLSKKGHVYRNPEIAGEIHSLLKKIEQEYLYWDNCSNHIMSGYLQIFFGMLLRKPNFYINNYVSNHTYIGPILNDIKQNFSSDITLNQIARDHSLSPEHLSRMFKHETGMTFHNYLTNIRLKEAECLLKKRHHSISEVAFACGFNDSNYFSTRFKSVYGISPLQFRRQYMEISGDNQK